MIYFMLFWVSAIIMDYKYIKTSKNIIFYIVIMILALGLAIYYFNNESNMGIAELFIKFFNMEVK